MANDNTYQYDKNVQVGDVREGHGGVKPLVRVDAIDGTKAKCTLLRSGNPKELSLATLRNSYYLVKRATP